MPLNKLPRLRNPTERDFVLQVRDMFLETYKREPELFYEEDMRQVRDVQFLLQRCIISKRKNIKESYNMLVAMLKWRKEHKLRELEDYDFPVDYFISGAAFLYEPDKFGNPTLYIRPDLVKNIAEIKASLKMYIAYLMYKIDDSIEGKSWAVVFDLTHTGWSNYDIDLLMHFLSLLKEYFPVNVDYVLAINFPWVLTTAWTFVKRLIPPERRDVVIFISEKEAKNYIDEGNLPDFLGGTCKREYRLSPKKCQTTVDYLLNQTEPEIPAKRIKEIIKELAPILPKENVIKMHKILEESGRR